MTKNQGIMVDILLVVRCTACGLVVRGADVAVERERALALAGKGCGGFVLARNREHHLAALRASAMWAGRASDRERQLQSLAFAVDGFNDFGCPWCATVEHNREQLASAQLPLPLEEAK